MSNVILPNLGIKLPDIGSNQDTWGNILNDDLNILDTAVQFDVISKTLSNVDVTLTAVEAASSVIDLSGTLTANVNVIVPATPVRLYLVRNRTSGAFTVTVKTAAGTGTPVQQGTSSLVYSDGANIIQGATSVNGSFAVSGALSAGSLSTAAATIAGGSINNTPVGNTTPSSGAFTNLSYTGTLTGSTGVVNIGSGQIYKDASGNVGIGTATPGAKLEVASNATDQFRLTRAGVRSYLHSVDGSGNLSISDGGSFSLNFTPAGNAGLGVTPSALWNPNHRVLDIAGVSQGHIVAQVNSLSLGINYLVNGSGNFAYQNNGFATRNQHSFSDGSVSWFTAPSGTAGNPITFTQAMTLTQGGNLLVGGTSEAALDGVFGAVIGGTSKPNAGVALESSISLWMTYTDDTAQALRFYDARLNVERARMTPGGYFKASNTGTYGGVAGLGDLAAGAQHIVQSDAAAGTLISINSNTTAAVSSYESYLATGSVGFHFKGYLNAVTNYQVLANGNVQNTNNSYGAISDAKLKENIVPATPKLANLMQLRVVNYNLKGDTLKQIGLVAQEVEQVFPGLVDETADTEQVTRTRTVEVPAQDAVLDEEGNEVTPAQPATTREEEYTESVPTGTVTKSVKYSVLVPMLLKAMQEQQSQIEALTARIAALEAR